MGTTPKSKQEIDRMGTTPKSKQELDRMGTTPKSKQELDRMGTTPQSKIENRIQRRANASNHECKEECSIFRIPTSTTVSLESLCMQLEVPIGWSNDAVKHSASNWKESVPKSNREAPTSAAEHADIKIRGGRPNLKH
jgi:hypothetical protein